MVTQKRAQAHTRVTEKDVEELEDDDGCEEEQERRTRREKQERKEQ